MLVAPRLRLARLWAAEELALIADELEGVLLPYPRELETPVRRFVKGVVGWEELVAKVRAIGLPYADVWSWTEEPLLRRLRTLSLGSQLSIECYGPPLADEARATEELLRLLLRTRVTGKVDLEAWAKLVGGGGPPLKSGYATLSLRAAEGASVIKWEYPMPPSDLLSSESLSEESVREYVDYVFEYIMRASSPDEAYLRWLSVRYRDVAEKLEKLAQVLGLTGGHQP